MKFLARKVAISKWQPVDGFPVDAISADAVTACLRTSGNELSVWECDLLDGELGRWDDSQLVGEVADVVLAFASMLQKPVSLDIVIFPMSAITEFGLDIEATAMNADTIVDDLKYRHMDIRRLDLTRLNMVAGIIASCVRSPQYVRRFREKEVIKVLKAAVNSRRLDVERLHDSQGGLKQKLQG